MTKFLKFFITLTVYFGALAFLFFQAKNFFLSSTLQKKESNKQYSESSASSLPTILFNETIDYENIKAIGIQVGKAFSGNKSQHFSEKLEYGYSISHFLSDILKYVVLKKLNCNLKISGFGVINDALLVCSIETYQGNSV